MQKTITVKGVGKVSAKPDFVVLSMMLESRNMKYEPAMDAAAQNIEFLNNALFKAGFEKDAVKTTNFNVHTDYDNIWHDNGTNKQIFKGYVVTHNLKVAFDFDSDRLSKALSTVSSCPANPQLNISFTVKDVTSVNEEMLRSATANAKRKAEILCEASGVDLGDLLSINYNWGELDIYSDTRYDVEYNCPSEPKMLKSIDIEPDDIDISDSATFVWEIS